MATGSEPIRVLHVEDDEGFAELTADLLEREGPFDVTTELDPTQALAHLTDCEVSVDCVVSDYDMPQMDGLDLLDAVRDHDLDLPFVLFTGKGSEEIASRAISAGVTDYLQKGGGTERFTLLANRVENAVSQHRTARELQAQERLSERIVMASPVAIVVHDVDGDVMLANDRATDLLGTEIEELDGTSYASAS
ncbi:MAG: response regulator [Halorientalis sp.]